MQGYNQASVVHFAPIHPGNLDSLPSTTVIIQQHNKYMQVIMCACEIILGCIYMHATGKSYLETAIISGTVGPQVWLGRKIYCTLRPHHRQNTLPTPPKVEPSQISCSRPYVHSTREGLARASSFPCFFCYCLQIKSQARVKLTLIDGVSQSRGQWFRMSKSRECQALVYDLTRFGTR